MLKNSFFIAEKISKIPQGPSIITLLHAVQMMWWPKAGRALEVDAVILAALAAGSSVVDLSRRSHIYIYR